MRALPWSLLALSYGGCTLSHDALGAAIDPSRSADASVAGPSARADASVLRPAEPLLDAAVAAEPGAWSTSDASAVEIGPPRGDAGASANDAGVSDAACAGTVELELCWYLSAPGTSCDAACASHGGFDDRALALLGTFYQGGSAQNCAYVLYALGARGTVATVSHYDGVGLGCHRWSGMSYWVDAPGWAFFASFRSAQDVQIACACAR